MRARRIIEGAAFGPEVIRTAIEAFEDAWNEIADHFEVAARDGARQMLATAIIAAARPDSTNAELLKGAGLRAMARAYPERFAAQQEDKAAGGVGE